MFAFLLFILNLTAMFVYLRFIDPFPKGQGLQYVAHPAFMIFFAVITSVLYFILTSKRDKVRAIPFFVWFGIFFLLMILIRYL